MPVTSKRVSTFTESVIRRMTRVASEFGAINLSQGFPDFAPPRTLLDSLGRVAIDGPHQYAITWGSHAFRSALARKLRRFMKLPIDPESELVVTCGSTEAMMVSMMTACNPGDKVIVFSPFYENYTADAILSGAIPVFVPLRPPHFEFDPLQLRRAFAEHRPKAIVLCNPANPTGRVFRRDELQVIADLATEFDAFVLADEVYEHIVYAPHAHTYIATLPGMFERTFSCSSLSKTYSITGWRLGYVVAPKHLVAQARKVHDFLTVGAAAPLQEAAVVALDYPDEYYEGLAALYAHKRSVFLDQLKRARLDFHEPEGAYFVMVDISEFGAKSDILFCEWLAREVGVAAVPGSSFFREDERSFVRFHFAKDEGVLQEAGRRLGSLYEKARGRTWAA
ncbi:MAG: aminotransferase class I/II-fold pyridoxal phosphate-dependent enzyme [Polyangiaceae bacterium]